MKRIFSIVLVCCLLFGTTVFEAKASSQTLLDLLKETNQNLLADILDNDWHESMQHIDVENKPMLLVYNLSLPAYVEDTYESIVSYAHENTSAEIYILQENPILLKEYTNKTQLAVVANFETIPTFVQDIMNGDIQQSFLGASCTVSNIICFTVKTTHQETTVVYDTDQGRYVRYYENETASAAVYTWDQYIEYAKAYYEYLSSYENNYDADGNPKYKGRITFHQFCKEPAQYVTTKIASKDWIMPVLIILSTVAIGFCGNKIYRRRRR